MPMRFPKKFKNIFIQILNEAIANNISIESPYDDETPQEGVFHWVCTYLDIAKLMFNTPNVIINRFDSAYKIGAARLAERKGSEVIDLLEFLIEKGLDINIRKNEKAPTLLESFINALFIYYDAIEYLIRHGARKDVKHSWAKKS